MATNNLQTIANGLQQHWEMMPPQQADQTLNTVVRASQYLENAMELQNASNQKLATALKVATQVTEQFHLGATSATQAAEKLEEVVQDLRSVVGKSS
jgi:methyl-accepting chemotaxis protein